MLSKKLDNCFRSRTGQVLAACKLWLNNDAKIVANANIGYGLYTLRHADGPKREFNDRQQKLCAIVLKLFLRAKTTAHSQTLAASPGSAENLH